MFVQLEGLAAAAVTTRPAPGPIIGPVHATMGAHHRHPDDWGRCVCGVSWVQSMTCHPCRLGPHTGRDCVDGPPTVQVAHRDGTPRWFYPDSGAGRWCACQHAAADGEPLAHAWTPPTVEVSVSSDPAFLATGHTVTVTIPGDALGAAENLAAAFGHPAYTTPSHDVADEVGEDWRPRPYLPAALAEVVDGSTPAAGFLRGLRSSEIAAEMLRMDRGLLARVTERQREALAEHARRPGPGRRSLAERLAATARRTEGASWAELAGEGVRAEVEMPDGERVEARVFFGPAARRVDAEAAAARATRLIGACEGAMT